MATLNNNLAQEVSDHNKRDNILRELNPHLSLDEVDILYHLAVDTSDLEGLRNKYRDVKFVCMGGSRGRVENFARQAYEAMSGYYSMSPDAHTNDIARRAGRFVMYKVGPVLTLNHGMGFGSLNIALHEVAKLLRYAGAIDFSFIRMGTSGGLGAEPGTVIITKEAYDATCEPGYEVVSCGKKVRYGAKADEMLNEEFIRAAEDLSINYQIGNTMGCDDFYEAQCRLDGALCDYTLKDKFDFIRRANKEAGVFNMEMEANVFLSFCNRAKIPGAVVCCSIVNRLKGDQITSTKEELKSFEQHPLQLILQVIKNRVVEAKGENQNS